MSNVCETCKRGFKFPWMLKRHFNRIIPCKVVEKDKIDQPQQKSTKNMPIYAKICQPQQKKYANICQYMPTVSNNILSNDFVDETDKRDKKCNYCNREFTMYTSLKRHQNELRCNKMKAEDMNQIILKKKNKKIEKIKNDPSTMALIQNNQNTISIKEINNGNITNSGTINTNTNSNNVNNTNNITNNITNNTIEIKINPMGKEDTSFLTKEDKIRILERMYNSLPELVKTIHNHPSNRNFYLPNTNKNIVACLNNNNQLEYSDYNSVCQQILEDNVERLDDLFNDLETEVTDSIRNRLERVLKKVEDGSLDKKWMKNIKMYVLNNSKRNKDDIFNYIEQIESHQ